MACRSDLCPAGHHMTGPSPAFESIGLMVFTQSKPLKIKMRYTWRPSNRSFLSHIFAPPNLSGNARPPRPRTVLGRRALGQS